MHRNSKIISDLYFETLFSSTSKFVVIGRKSVKFACLLRQTGKHGTNFGSFFYKLRGCRQIEDFICDIFSCNKVAIFLRGCGICLRVTWQTCVVKNKLAMGSSDSIKLWQTGVPSAVIFARKILRTFYNILNWIAEA